MYLSTSYEPTIFSWPTRMWRVVGMGCQLLCDHQRIFNLHVPVTEGFQDHFLKKEEEEEVNR